MNSSNFRSIQLLKEWPLHRKFGKSLILALLSFRLVSNIPYYINFRFNDMPNMSSILAFFLCQFVNWEIIERSSRGLCLVLGPFTALYRSFLKRCTLTNKAVGTIWRALSKPPQRRQGPDPRPLWLLVGAPSAFGPELAYRLRVVQPTLMDVPIFLYTFILLYMSVYHIFITSPLWLAVGPQSL